MIALLSAGCTRIEQNDQKKSQLAVGASGETAMTLSVENLDAPLGAEIRGLDISKPLDRSEIGAIEEAWRTRLVVVFRGQTLSDPQLLAFSRYFGELDPPGPNPYGEPFNKQFPQINVIQCH
jgi:taurine dioxygenase